MSTVNHKQPRVPVRVPVQVVSMLRLIHDPPLPVLPSPAAPGTLQVEMEVEVQVEVEVEVEVQVQVEVEVQVQVEMEVQSEVEV